MPLVSVSLALGDGVIRTFPITMRTIEAIEAAWDLPIDQVGKEVDTWQKSKDGPTTMKFGRLHRLVCAALAAGPCPELEDPMSQAALDLVTPGIIFRLVGGILGGVVDALSGDAPAAPGGTAAPAGPPIGGTGSEPARSSGSTQTS